MSDDKFHFEIPKDNVRKEKYEKTGGGVSVQVANRKEHGLKLQDQTKALLKREQEKRDCEFTEDLYLQIETQSEYKLKGQRINIESLGFEIMNYSKENQSIGTARIQKEKFDAFNERLVVYTNSIDHVGRTYFDAINQISPIPVENKIRVDIDYDSEEEVAVVINLFNVLASKERLAIMNMISEELRKHTENVRQNTFSNGISSIECKIKANVIPQIASDFSTVKEIRKNHTFITKKSVPIAKMPNPLHINSPDSSSIVCVVDDGISDSNPVLGSLVAERKMYLPVGSTGSSCDHGTFVASRCVFGDDIDQCLATHILTPYCRILDAQIFGIDANGDDMPSTEYDLRIALDDLVRSTHDRVKVYNLSLGGDDPIRNHEYSEIAKLIDYLSKEFRVLFIIAAGNIDGQLGTFPVNHFGSPYSRIGIPAEALLGLTVGSVAKYVNTTSLSPAGFISPFSRIGPGADEGVKPELVAHGGNMMLPYNQSPRISTYGISHDGLNLAVGIGTSHSTPLISQYAQRLFDLYPGSEPNLVKALLCHFSNRRSIHEDITDEPINYVGFGEPDIDSAIRAGDNNAAYVYEGKLDQENYDHVPFHIPTSLAAGDTDSKLKIRITITYDPPVNPDNESEYSNSRISATLLKPTDSRFVPITLSGGENYHKPWNPIIQFEKTFSRSYLTGLWELRLRLYTRGKVSASYLQDYSVVVEIVDENRHADVYADILSEYSEVYKRIAIRIAA